MLTLAWLYNHPLTTAGWWTVCLLLLAGIVLLCFYILLLYRRMPKYHTPLIGHMAVVVAWDGHDRRVEVFGAIWQARLPDDQNVVLQPGNRVRVQALHNLILTIIPIGD